MRKCPNCGQPTVRTKDWACPWCGYPLLSRSYGEIPKTYEELKPKAVRSERPPVMERTGVSPVPKPEPKVKPEAKPVTEPITVTVEEMHSAFKADNAAVDAGFASKIITITGVVGGLAINDVGNNATLILKSAQKIGPEKLLCVFDMKYIPEFRRLAMGQTVTVQGKYDSYTVNALMVDCVLVG